MLPSIAFIPNCMRDIMDCISIAGAPTAYMSLTILFWKLPPVEFHMYRMLSSKEEYLSHHHGYQLPEYGCHSCARNSHLSRERPDPEYEYRIEYYIGHRAYHAAYHREKHVSGGL